MNSINVSIIIVNWNGKEDTLACLASVGKLSHKNITLSVIVVDNGSSDNSVAVIENTFPKTIILKNSYNLGFTGGNNTGIRHALGLNSDYIWLLNNDTVVHVHALEALVSAEEKTKAGIVGSKIYFFRGKEFHHDRYKESERGHVLWYAGGKIDWKNMYASHRGVDEVDKGQYDKTEETLFVTGCSMMVAKEVFEKIGLFDEKFFAYLEDLDFCLRAKQMGYKLLYVPQSILWHKNAGSSGVGSQLHQYYMTRNRLLVGMHYASARTKVALIREGIRFILAGPPIRRKAILDAIF